MQGVKKMSILKYQKCYITSAPKEAVKEAISFLVSVLFSEICEAISSLDATETDGITMSIVFEPAGNRYKLIYYKPLYCTPVGGEKTLVTIQYRFATSSAEKIKIHLDVNSDELKKISAEILFHWESAFETLLEDALNVEDV